MVNLALASLSGVAVEGWAILPTGAISAAMQQVFKKSKVIFIFNG
jgi:hypothetical protein